MCRDKLLKEARNKNILKSFMRYEKEKVGSIQKYSHAAIAEMVSQQFFLSRETISNIVAKERSIKNKKTKNVG